MKSNTQNILYYILFVWVIAEVFIAAWMFHLKPKKDISKKYPRKIIFLSQLPFGSSWKKSMAKEDVNLFERYQFSRKVLFFSLMVPFLILLFLLITSLIDVMDS